MKPQKAKLMARYKSGGDKVEVTALFLPNRAAQVFDRGINASRPLAISELDFYIRINGKDTGPLEFDVDEIRQLINSRGKKQ